MPNPNYPQVFGNAFAGTDTVGNVTTLALEVTVENDPPADISAADHVKKLLNEISSNLNALTPLPQYFTIEKITSIIDGKNRDRFTIEIDSELSEGLATDEA